MKKGRKEKATSRVEKVAILASILSIIGSVLTIIDTIIDTILKLLGSH